MQHHFLHPPVAVVGDDGVVDGRADAGDGAEQSVDVAAHLPADGSLVERVDYQHRHVQHHRQIEQSQVHDEHVGGSPQRLGSNIQ